MPSPTAHETCISDTRSILGLRRPRFVKEPTPALISARTGATVVLTCALGSTAGDGNQVPQWFKAVLDANGKPVIIHSPWGDELYQSEPLVANPRMSGVHSTTLTITNFQPEDAGAYFVHVFNEYSATQSAIARVKHVNTDVAPVFLRQPVSRQAMPGDMVSFDVQVNGSPAPQYLWKRNGIALVNGPGISGADASALVLSNVQLASGGSFTCTVTCGTKKGTSLPGVLTVKEPAAPVIATAPKPVTADPGANVQFSVVVKGGFPTAYTYQWQKEDGGIWADMSGYTTSSFSIVGITEDDGGKYRCVVSNGAGGANLRTVTSSEAALTLNGLPVITEDPDDATAQYGSTVSFSGAATGIPAPTLQWYRVVDGGVPVALIGQTRTTLNLTLTGEPWASGEAFQVFLRAKNRFGSRDSAMANLTLEDPFDSPASVGRYLGLIAPSSTLNNDLGGRIDLKLTRVGSYTGTLNMAGRLYPFKGTCDEQGKSDVTILRTGLPALVARLTFDGSGALTGLLWQTGDHLPQDLISAHQVPWVATTNPATGYAGSYTAALQPPTPLPADSPEGTGWMKYKISKAGTCSGSGRLADGTPVTLASVVWPDGSLPLFVSLYTKAGSVLGTVDCATTPLQGSLRWRIKPATPPAGRNYANGIGPLDLAVTGGRYTAPRAGQYLLGLTSTQAGGLTLTATGGGLTLPQTFAFTLSRIHVATFGISTKSSAPKLTFSAATGTVTGSFVVTDTQVVDGKTVALRRTATVSGVLLSPAGMVPARILGHFLLPGLLPTPTTSPILSGAMQVVIP